jgi:hypothetical protein
MYLLSKLHSGRPSYGGRPAARQKMRRGLISRRTIQENEMKSSARMLATLAVAVLLTPMLSLHAQGTVNPSDNGFYTPKVEIFLGYSHIGTYSTDTVIGNRMVGLNGGSASVAYNFNNYLGLVADFGGYAADRLQLTGGSNSPVVVDASGTVYTYLFGPRLSFRNSTRFTPFAQVLGGGVYATDVAISGCTGSPACTPLPAQNAFALTAGGGLDIRLTQHFSLRPIQAEYLMTTFDDVPTGASAIQNNLRLSAGIVYGLGGEPPVPVQLACSVQPDSAFPGDPLTVTATATNLNPKRRATYSWSTNAGSVSGSDATAPINTANVAPGTYTITGHVMQGSHAAQQASCTASFTIQSPAPPTIACSANPSSLQSGDSSTITAQAVSPQNRTLTYSYTTTAGTITGNTSTATLSTTGVEPGAITVTCNVVDDLGKTATDPTTVTVLPPPAPQTSELCGISFERDTKRPLRVDNEAKGCLDDISLEMQRESTGRLVIVGNYSSNEEPAAGAKRTLNVRQYLTDEKGIDSSRIDLRVGTDSGRTVSNVFVPEGATYVGTGTTSVDTTIGHRGEPYGKPHYVKPHYVKPHHGKPHHGKPHHHKKAAKAKTQA